jgi:SAM-dependent methyltransferase
MIQQTLEDTLTINKLLYQKHAIEFSKSREIPWDGWSRAVEYLNNKYCNVDKLNFLDIACGDGRFGAYLKKKLKISFKYLVIDSSPELINIAKMKLAQPEYSFKITDVLTDGCKGLKELDKKSDVISVFGLTHHLPTPTISDLFFKNIFDHTFAHGSVISSFWQFDRIPKFKDLRPDSDGIFYLPWSKEARQRACHLYSDEDINHVKDIAVESGMRLESEFESDGRSSNLNKYLIWSKI